MHNTIKDAIYVVCVLGMFVRAVNKKELNNSKVFSFQSNSKHF